jgi:hypothetical protein
LPVRPGAGDCEGEVVVRVIGVVPAANLHATGQALIAARSRLVGLTAR